MNISTVLIVVGSLVSLGLVASLCFFIIKFVFTEEGLSTDMSKYSILIIIGVLILAVGFLSPATTTTKDCANPDLDYQEDLTTGGCDVVVEEENDNAYKEPVMVVGGGIIVVGFVLSSDLE